MCSQQHALHDLKRRAQASTGTYASDVQDDLSVLSMCDRLTRGLCSVQELVAKEAARFQSYSHLWTRDVESSLAVCRQLHTIFRDTHDFPGYMCIKTQKSSCVLSVSRHLHVPRVFNPLLTVFQEVAKVGPLEGPGGAEGALLAACEAEIQRYKALQEELLVGNNTQLSVCAVNIDCLPPRRCPAQCSVGGCASTPACLSRPWQISAAAGQPPFPHTCSTGLHRQWSS